jgi:hypothetical protein
MIVLLFVEKLDQWTASRATGRSLPSSTFVPE